MTDRKLATNVGLNQGIQQTYSTGKRGYVAVDLQDMPLVFPTAGGRFMNTFMAGEELFEGDLCEFNLTKRTILVLRTYELAKAVTATDTEILIVKDNGKKVGRHIPFQNEILMKAPSTLTGTGTGVVLGAVTTDTYSDSGVQVEVYKVAIEAGAFGTAAKGDVLIEAAEAGASKRALVQNPNSFLFSNLVFNYPSIQGTDTFSGSISLYTPVIKGVYWANRMSPMPASVKALSKSRIAEYFEL